MATAIQRRRGTSLQHTSFTGLAGELTVDTDLNTVIVHDGSTQGGYRLAKYSEVVSAAEGDITAVVAGSGLTGGSNTGSATISLDYENLTGNLIPSANNTYSLGSLTNVWKDVFVGPGSLYVNGQKVLEDNSGTIQISADTNQNIHTVTTGTGDIEFTAGGAIQMKSNVVLSSGLSITTSGGSATKFGGNVNLNSNNINNVDDPVMAQDAATKAYVDAQVAGKDNLGELSGNTDDITEGVSNLYFTDARADARADVRIAAADTDDLSEGSSNLYYTSGRANTDFDTRLGTKDTDDVAEGTTNLYFTNARADARADLRIAAADTDDLTEGSTNLYYTSSRANTDFDTKMSAADTDDLSEGSTNQYYTDARARASVSVSDTGGDGALSYNSTTGVFTYTGPSSSEIEARIDGHLVGGDGLTYGSGVMAVDSTVVRTSGDQTISGEKTFSDPIIINGNLTVSGTTTYLNTETLTVDDNIVVLNNNASGTPSENAGLQVNRGSSADVSLRWNESSDAWEFTNDGSTYQPIPVDTDDLAEGSNEYFTTARARAAVSATGDLSYSSSTGVFSFTERTDAEVRGLVSASGDLSYNSTTGVFSITERTDAEVRGLVSVSDAGGDGSLSYNSTSGVITYTGPSASEVRSHFSGGTGVSVSNGVVSIGQSVGTTDSVSFNVVTATLDGVCTSIANHTTANLTENSNLYFTNERVDDRVNALLQAGTGISLSYDDANGTLTITGNVGDITGVTAGAGLTGGGSSGTPTLNVGAGSGISVAADSVSVSGIDVSHFAGGAIQTGSEAFADSDSVLMTAAAVQDKIASYGYTTNVGDITAVTAGSGLSGGGSSGGVTLNVSGLAVSHFAGSAIQTSAEAYIDSDAVLMTAAAANDRFQSAGSYVTTNSAQSLRSSDAIQVSNDTITIFKGDGTSESVTISDAYENYSHWAFDTSSNANNESVTSGDVVRFEAGTGMTVNHSGDTITFTCNIVNTDTNTTYSAGTDLSLSGTTFNVQSATAATANTLAKRDSSGNLTANVFNGTATSARYADLAEKYATDAELEAGTVVMFGGEAEVKACDSENCHAVAGVISTDPAYMMNSDAQGQYVALAGRVPCKVTGPVAKGDLMVSAGNGMAKANNDAQAGRIIGKAIGSSEGGEAVIEVLVNMM